MIQIKYSFDKYIANVSETFYEDENAGSADELAYCYLLRSAYCAVKGLFCSGLMC